MNVSGQLLADFIRSLYPPDGPYRFEAIADDLLGIIYERFLGSIITVRRRRVEVEQKPEVRHAKGVYYTPRFVVDTIIRRVVGPQLENRVPLDVLELKILDPACGSGSFLIAAFQYLMDHCLRHFAAHPEAAEVPATPRARKRKRELAFQDADGQWNLAPDFKAAILTSCLYGVDIDAQAVEVTIMSLYLKMLEGKLPPNWQRDWLEKELLPPLDNNIHCGNSLLSQTDFDRWWEEKHANLFAGDQDTRFRMNPFDWTSHTRGFGRLFEDGSGFDAIIGNPPYIRVQELKKWAPDECEFYKWHYQSAAKGNYDIYVVFIERALELLAPTGILGFICPHKFWQAKYGEGLRKIIAEGKHLRSLIDFTDQQVFRGGTTYTAVQVFSKTPNGASVDYASIAHLQDGDAQCRAIDAKAAPQASTRFNSPHPTPSSMWTFQSVGARAHSEVLRAATSVRLADIALRMFQGIRTSMNPVYVLHRSGRSGTYHSNALGRDVRLEPQLLKPFLAGEDIRRYCLRESSAVVLLPYHRSRSGGRITIVSADELRQDFPNTWKYLLACEQGLRGRERGRMNHDQWYGYVYPKNLDVFGRPRIVVRDIVESASFAIDTTGSRAFVSGYGIILKREHQELLLYILGALNSKLLDHFLKSVSTTLRGGWFRAFPQFMGQLPIKLPDTPAERRDAERISERVRQIIEGKKKLQATSLGQRERERLERQVEAHEAAIDELVCRLYGVDAIPNP